MVSVWFMHSMYLSLNIKNQCCLVNCRESHEVDQKVEKNIPLSVYILVSIRHKLVFGESYENDFHLKNFIQSISSNRQGLKRGTTL